MKKSTYTIQYSDDNGTHTIEVSSGEVYSLESIPERLGYTFLGLYDAEVGGTQYVNSSGLSVSAYTDKTDITLYPQYQAIEYTIILDYGEAAVTGSRQYSVAYGESLPSLPTNLTVSHKVFSGWYTEENCGGTKVADSYGLLPLVSVLNSDNFEITSSTAYLYLYAGFTIETYSVTFNYGSGMASETMEVEYGTNVSDIVTSTRDSNGYAVVSWGLSYSGSEYTGTITEDISLYALEWAPVITFDSNGGDAVTSIVARAGDVITLPTATKQSYGFVCWVDSEGNEATFTVMPDTNITLYAVWSEFDGGSGKQTDPYLISTAEQFNKISDYDGIGVYFTLTDDIDFSCALTPLLTFFGVLDGQSHSLSNFTISSSETYVGLFKSNSGTISNLTISGATVTVKYDYDVYAGVLAGANNGTIDNCKIKSSKVSGYAQETSAQSSDHARYAVVGGLVGINNGTIKNSSVITSTIYGDSQRCDGNGVGGSNDIAVAYVGGLVGEVSTGAYVSNCSVTDMASISGYGYFQFYYSSTQKPYIKVAVGGVAGFVHSGAVCSDCTSDMADSSSLLSASYSRWNSSSVGGSKTDYCLTYVGGLYGINNS